MVGEEGAEDGGERGGKQREEREGRVEAQG